MDTPSSRPSARPLPSERELDECLRILVRGSLDVRPFRNEILRTLELLQTDWQQLYTPMDLPKPDGRMRRVYAPAERLKFFQRLFVTGVANVFDRSEYAWAFQPEVSPQIGLRVACDALDRRAKETEGAPLRAVYSLDIRDFFPSIAQDRVEKAYYDPLHRILCHRRRACGKEVPSTIARVYASLSCLNGSLIQGPPTSPVAADLVAAPMDRAIVNQLPEGYEFMRYADDLTVLAPEPITRSVRAAVRGVVESPPFGFQVHHGKTRYEQDRGQEGYDVLGMTVLPPDPSAEKPLRFKIPRGMEKDILREIRALRDAGDAPTERAVFMSDPRVQRIIGRMAYASYVMRCGERVYREGVYLCLPSDLANAWTRMRHDWGDRLPPSHARWFTARGAIFEDVETSRVATPQDFDGRVVALAEARGEVIADTVAELAQVKRRLNRRYNTTDGQVQSRGNGESYPDTDIAEEISDLVDRLGSSRTRNAVLHRDIRAMALRLAAFVQSRFDGTMQGHYGHGQSLLPVDLADAWSALLDAVDERAEASPEARQADVRAFLLGLDDFFHRRHTATQWVLRSPMPVFERPAQRYPLFPGFDPSCPT